MQIHVALCDDGLIIYLTSSADFAVESYNTDALHYLLKPVSNSQFFQCMDKAISRLSRSPEETIPIKTPDSTRIVVINTILYAERVSRHVRYYLSDNTVIDSVTFNDTFQNAVSLLASRPGFLIVGSSFLVKRNMLIGRECRLSLTKEVRGIEKAYAFIYN